MKLTSSSRLSLFLIELVLVILFFSLSSAVCMFIFVHSKNISTDSKRLSEAVIEAQNIAEQYKLLSEDEFLKLSGSVNVSASPLSFEAEITEGMTLFFIETYSENGLRTAHISICCESDTVFELDVCK